MKKSSVIIIILVSIFAIFIGYKYYQDDKVVENKDSVKFKEEYESLNGKTNPNNNNVYSNLEILENNVKYSSYEDVIELLKSGTGVVFLGYPESELSRTVVPILLESITESEIDTLYYVNVKDGRDVLYADKNKVVVQKEGSKGYLNLVNALDKILDEYILIGEDGTVIPSGRKRLEVPAVIYVKDGDIVGYNFGTVESHTDPYKELDERQKEELLLKLINLGSIVKGTICDEKC